MKWDTACRPTDDPFWAFLSPSAQEPVQPPNNICLVLAAEKNIYIGHSSKKDNHPFHSKAFVLLYKFETSWALLGRLSRFFFFFWPSQGPLIFKHFKQPFMTLLDWLASSGNKIQKRLENILAHANLWRGSTQIECSSQKMAQQVRK